MRQFLWAMGLICTASLGFAAEDGFTPLYNGKDLSNWEGREDLWKAGDGMISGISPGLKENHFLVSKEEYGNFELRFDVRMPREQGNSGVQFWSHRVPNSTEMKGYQADIGVGYWGSLYDESRRNKLLATAKPEVLQKVLKDKDWNEYVVRAEGKHITIAINGETTIDYTETDDAIPLKGRFGLQVHSGGAFQVDFRNPRIKVLK
jgi:hypothetical protein